MALVICATGEERVGRGEILAHGRIRDRSTLLWEIGRTVRAGTCEFFNSQANADRGVDHVSRSWRAQLAENPANQLADERERRRYREADRRCHWTILRLRRASLFWRDRRLSGLDSRIFRMQATSPASRLVRDTHGLLQLSTQLARLVDDLGRPKWN